MKRLAPAGGQRTVGRTRVTPWVPRAETSEASEAMIARRLR